jgi:antitoxin component of MazEF toxin-antitoxin module
MELVVRKLGNSVGVTLPTALLRDLDISVGQSFAVTRTPDNALVLRLQRPRKRYSAAELNQLCNLKAPMPADLQSWEAMPAAGDEAP